ncbi:hypothetical protein N7516_010018 [Penicillium verrucosum]|uniref:uncharacterized protein n=1 Tax=Penicillium verrucosum TaxID=60171 RepID=UPI002544F1BF|nr:uncharacterized protein N7516_010018 [Penicillium verrucosum]KAJ5922315.1 hypothetical protein N7516_010018 [Penicillium verrucosum]
MLKKVLLAAALMGSTLANPLSDYKTPLAPREDGETVPDDDACSVFEAAGNNNVEVYATKESMPIDQVCGQGYLDNFRGRCGIISNWGCMFVDENVKKVEEKEKNEDQITGAKMTFHTNSFCSSYDIIAAMAVSSAADGKKPEKCFESPKWMLP